MTLPTVRFLFGQTPIVAAFLLSGCGQKASTEEKAVVGNVPPPSATVESSIDQHTSLDAPPPRLMTAEAQNSAGEIRETPAMIRPTPQTVEIVPVRIDQVAVAKAQLLIEQLMSPGLTPEGWDQAMADLEALGPAAIEPLAKLAREGRQEEREFAITTLAMVGDDSPSAHAALQHALKDSSAHVRANAAAGLMQSPENVKLAIPVFVELLNNSDQQIRSLAAMNLSSLGSDAAPYVSELAKLLAAEDSPEILTPVVELLGRIGPPAETVVPKLQQIAFEKSGDVADAAKQAIQLIKPSVSEVSN